MVRRCVVGGCSSVPGGRVTLYALPDPSKDSKLRRQWEIFTGTTTQASNSRRW